MVEFKEIKIDPYRRNIPKRCWKSFTRFIQNHADFYQLLAISAFVESRLHQIKPKGVELSDRLAMAK
jgi:hypothetical protein